MQKRFSAIRNYQNPGSRTILGGLILIAVVLVVFRNTWAITLYEDAAFAISPSAQIAAAYGERHMDARNPPLYNIDRAEYFYKEAAALDPTYPYVFHQLARIAFLRGDFLTALIDIDREIKNHGDTEHNTYYVRGLIEGYAGNYAAAAKDYEHFLSFDPNNWAGVNDYAWVLLKAQRFQDAADVTQRALKLFPDNAWLLNSNATANFELHHYDVAFASVQKASIQVQLLSEGAWLHAYPGNDPGVAQVGIETFKKAVADNMHTIQSAMGSSTLQ